jgi:hypothetical protein
MIETSASYHQPVTQFTVSNMSHNHLLLGIILFPAIATLALILSVTTYIQCERTRRYNNRNFRQLRQVVINLSNETEKALYETERRALLRTTHLMARATRPQTIRTTSRAPSRHNHIVHAARSSSLLARSTRRAQESQHALSYDLEFSLIIELNHALRALRPPLTRMHISAIISTFGNSIQSWRRSTSDEPTSETENFLLDALWHALRDAEPYVTQRQTSNILRRFRSVFRELQVADSARLADVSFDVLFRHRTPGVHRVDQNSEGGESTAVESSASHSYPPSLSSSPPDPGDEVAVERDLSGEKLVQSESGDSDASH